MKLTVLILSVSGMILSSRVFAATIRVPSDQPTIQAGIDGAVDGDTVLVADGTYTGVGNRDIDFKGKAITVTSENGPETCIIDCQGTETERHRGFYLHKYESENTAVVGFTVQKGYHSYGGAIYCVNASLTISNCIFIENKAICEGAGICLDRSSNTTIADSAFTENAAEFGGGIYFIESNNTTIVNSIFLMNTVEMYGGGMYLDSCQDAKISNCTFTRNAARNGGGIDTNTGLGFDDRSSSTITNCTFTENTAEFGGGVLISKSNSSTITNCAFTKNTANYGGGVYFVSTIFSNISNCVFTENTAVYYGGGFVFAGHGSYTITDCITNCIFTKNTAGGVGGGIYFEFKSDSRISNCTFTENSSNSDGGGICSMQYADLTISNCILWNDTPREVYFEDNNSTLTYSLIQGGYPGVGNIGSTPNFIGGDPFDYRLSPYSSCIDAGTDENASSLDLDDNPRPLGGAVDLGAYEYQGFPLVSRAYVKMPSHMFYPGDKASCSVSVWNVENTTPEVCALFVVLDVFGSYYCAPSFSPFDHYSGSFQNGMTEITVIPEFIWPNAGSASNIVWYAFLTNPEMTALASEIGVFDFGWRK